MTNHQRKEIHMNITIKAPTAQEMFELALNHTNYAVERFFPKLLDQVRAAAQEGVFSTEREFYHEKIKYTIDDLEKIADKFYELGFLAYVVKARDAIVIKWDAEALSKVAILKAKYPTRR